MSEGAKAPAKKHVKPSPPVFQAREGLSTDFSDIAIKAQAQKEATEPALGLDEALGVRWVKPRGRIVGVRYGTLRQRRAMEMQLQVLQSEGATEEEQYEAGIKIFQPLLVLPDASSPSGVREMTIEEIEERVDLVDFQPLAQLAFPAASPVKALLEAGADPN